MTAKRQSQADDAPRLSGDPGVGGLLADPLASDASRDEIDPGAGAPSPDPRPPQQHLDWSPNKKPDVGKGDSDA